MAILTLKSKVVIGYTSKISVIYIWTMWTTNCIAFQTLKLDTILGFPSPWFSLHSMTSLCVSLYHNFMANLRFLHDRYDYDCLCQTSLAAPTLEMIQQHNLVIHQFVFHSTVLRTKAEHQRKLHICFSSFIMVRILKINLPAVTHYIHTS